MTKHPSDYHPHQGDVKRFHTRQYNPGLGDFWQVYGCDLQHICDCPTQEMAEMVAAALEQAANESDALDKRNDQ